MKSNNPVDRLKGRRRRLKRYGKLMFTSTESFGGLFEEYMRNLEKDKNEEQE